MTKNKNPQDDEELFRKSMKGVKPLKSSNRVFYHPPAKKPAKRDILEKPNKIPYIHHAPLVGADEQLSYLKQNVDAKLLRALKKGKYCPELTLDLHGFTLVEAESQLTEFFQYAKMQSVKTVLIVHGKGKQLSSETPKMKNLVNRYLLSLPNVLAFCSAKPTDGGTGAVYVLISKG